MTTTKKNTTLELTIATGYVAGWGLWEGYRELLQNALDASDQGYDMTVKYLPKKQGGTVQLTTEGTTLDRSTLLLGGTSKHDDANQRGQFGEGYKLAWNALLRAGYTVWAKSGSERWIPSVKHSANFDSELLAVDVAPCKFVNSIVQEIRGVSEQEWAELQPHVLPENAKGHATSWGQILTDKKHAGKLFNRGLFVTNLPGSNFTFGYDLYSVELDRDRKMADPYSLKHNLRSVLREAVANGDIDAMTLQAMFSDDAGEKSIGESYQYYGQDTVTDTLAADFRTTHGDKAIACATTAQTMKAALYGLKGIVVPNAMLHALQASMGSFDVRLANEGNNVSETHGADDLTLAELDNLMWAMDLVSQFETSYDANDTSVVTFATDSLYGTYDNGSVNLARTLLDNRVELLATLSHEASHAYGPDGSVEHRNATETLLARIACR